MEIEVLRRQAQAFGVKIADDPKSPGDFAVVCSQHKVIGRGMTISQAREIQDAHLKSHSAA